MTACLIKASIESITFLVRNQIIKLPLLVPDRIFNSLYFGDVLLINHSCYKSMCITIMQKFGSHNTWPIFLFFSFLTLSFLQSSLILGQMGDFGVSYIDEYSAINFPNFKVMSICITLPFCISYEYWKKTKIFRYKHKYFERSLTKWPLTKQHW